MEQLSPQMLSMVDDLLKDRIDEINQLRSENENLREKLRVFQQGSQYSRDDYYKLENRVREEISKNDAYIRRIHELESNIQNVNSKSQMLESQLKNFNNDITSRVREKQDFEDQIKELRSKLSKMEDTEREQRKEYIKLSDDKNDLNKQVNDLTQTNYKLNQAVEELLNRDGELKNALMDRIGYITELEEKIDEHKQRISKLEKTIKKYKQNTNVEINEAEQELDKTLEASVNYGNIQAELEDAKEKIKNYKYRILALEEEERRNDRLTEALNKRNVMIERLQKQVDEKENQIIEFHRAKKDLIQKVETYRERVEEKRNENLNDLEEFREQAKIYKENYEIAEKRVRKLEEEAGKKTKEVDELQRMLDEKLDGTHGLRKVVNKMKELRAMLDVRDHHIAELVAQLNTMDKIMTGLSRQVDPNFDINHFLKTYDTENFDDEKIRTEQAARDLEKKIQMMKERGPTPRIKVVLNKDQRPIKTVIVEGDEEPYESPGSKSRRSSRRTSDVNVGDSIRIPPKQRHMFGHKKFKPPGEVEEDDKPVTTFKEMETQTKKLTLLDLVGNEDNDYIEGINSDSIDRDEWIVNLRRKYFAVVQERDDLKRRYDELAAEYERLLNEHKDLRAGINQNDDESKPVAPSSLTQSSVNLGFSTNPSQQIIDRSNYTDRSCQTKKKHNFKVESQLIYSRSRKIHLTKVNFTDTKSNAIILPSDEERAIFKAKQDALKIELEKVRHKLAEYKHELELRLIELDQLRELKDKLQDTIDRLNKQLIEQREAYKEGLSQLRNEADRYAESQVREALDVNRVQNRLRNENLANLDGPNLDNVSTRMNELNHMKNRLEDQLKEEKASSQLAQKKASLYKDRLEKAEAEIARLNEELEKRKNDSKLTEYNAELHVRMKNLERRYRDLKKENAELKQSRPARNDPKQFTEHPIDASDNEDQLSSSRNFSVIRTSKTAEAKIMALKTQNEEMQLKLGKAQGTIDRLNQLLQRKEGQVEKLKEQASSFKHQIIAKQKEVNLLRSKLHP